MSDLLRLASDFSTHDADAWRALVDKVVKAPDGEETLRRASDDGVTVRPLYHPGNATIAERGFPGAPPFVRGSRAAGSTAGGWDVRQRHAHPDPATVNRHIHEDLERGVTSIQLVIDDALAAGRDEPNGVVIDGADALAQALHDVPLDVAGMGLQAGGRGVELARQWLDHPALRDAGLPAFNIDPIGAVLRGFPLDPEPAVEDAVRLARDLPASSTSSVLLADGRPFHAAGATAAQEIAFTLATALAYLQALEGAGIEIEKAAPLIGFAHAADTDFFETVAKLRAARLLWSSVVAECGGGADAQRAILHAETAMRTLTRRDPWVNMLRNTVAGFAAGIGGADSLTVLPFDHALGLPDAFARRIARNTQLVLVEESNVHQVIDPVGGSLYVETLTDQLAEVAWSIFQEVERRGGLLTAARDGWVQAQIADAAATRWREVRTRVRPITGTSEFPMLAETQPVDATARVEAARLQVPERGAAPAIDPLPERRLAEPFERLRDRSDAALAGDGGRPRVFLAHLGRIADFNARSNWAVNLLESGGIEPVRSEPLADADAVGAAFTASGCRAAAIASSDEVYVRLASPALRALASAHASCILVIGRPRDIAEELDAAGATHLVHDGMDVVDVLEDLHDALDAPNPAEAPR